VCRCSAIRIQAQIIARSFPASRECVRERVPDFIARVASLPLAQIVAIILEKPKRLWYNSLMDKKVREYLAAIGKEGGSSTSKDKAAAARKNGALGGRGRKRKGRKNVK
jgi:hypothetical protein